MKFGAITAMSVVISQMLWASEANSYQYNVQQIPYLALGNQYCNNPSATDLISYGPRPGYGFAFHIKGWIPVNKTYPERGYDEGGYYNLLTIINDNPNRPAPFVSSISLNFSMNSTSNIAGGLSAQIVRTINGQQIPYSIVENLSPSGGNKSYSGQPIYDTAAGEDYNYIYENVDLWFYAFPNEIWLESQSAPSALGKAYDALALFGYYDQSASSSFGVTYMSDCSASPFGFIAPTITVYSVPYDSVALSPRNFVSTINQEYATATTYTDPATGLAEEAALPFRNNGARRLGAAF